MNKIKEAAWMLGILFCAFFGAVYDFTIGDDSVIPAIRKWRHFR